MRPRQIVPGKPLMTKAETKADYNLSDAQYYDLIKNPKVKAVVIGGVNMVVRASVEEYIAEHAPRPEFGVKPSPRVLGQLKREALARAAEAQGRPPSPAELREREREAKARADRKAKADRIRAAT
jgi:hypothetical protein